jgi:sulfur relay (sulfurtransferase) DsrC/TusE family protein
MLSVKQDYMNKNEKWSENAIITIIQNFKQKMTEDSTKHISNFQIYFMPQLWSFIWFSLGTCPTEGIVCKSQVYHLRLIITLLTQSIAESTKY